MTLSQRNYYFRAGIAVSALCIAGIAVHASKLLTFYPDLAEEAVRRTSGLFQGVAEQFFPAFSQAPFAGAAAAAVYALVSSLLIYLFFEKTHSPEILFFDLFSFSLVFEVLRLMAPFRELYGFPGLFLVMGARLLFFGRFFGVLSLFAASIYASGFELQKQGNAVLTIAVAGLFVSLGIPIDGFSWDSNFVMISGYGTVFRHAETGILAVSVLSFFIAAYTRGSKDYLFIGLGMFLVSLGRNLFIHTDILIILIPGFIMLCAGTWLAAAKLHQVYLWL